MREYLLIMFKYQTYNHYSINNAKGYPGMRFESIKTYKIRNNACLNCNPLKNSNNIKLLNDNIF